MDTEEIEFKEGFICPICLLDLTSVNLLLAHFEKNHGSVDKDVIQTFKGFVKKAKKKLLNDESSNVSFIRSLNPFDDCENESSLYEFNNSWNWELYWDVPSRTHTSYFKRIRSSRIDAFVAETNKLIIRLDKLLKDVPSDIVKRKVHEKGIVAWANDKDVPLCPSCAKSFGITRRRHHCRLCGSIMCDNCSKFITFQFAKKLVDPVQQDVPQESQKYSKDGVLSITGLKRSNSQGSLNSLMSVVDSVTGEQHFRLCSPCLDRLEARDYQLEQHKSRPVLTFYYEQLIEYKAQLETLLPQFLEMQSSLNDGETTYQLYNASEIRLKILKLSDHLSSLALKIRNYGTAKEDNNSDEACTFVGPRQELLQRRIHQFAAIFVKDNILGLPKLPSPEECQKNQEKRRIQAESRTIAKQQAEREAEERALQLLKKKENSASPRDATVISPGHSPKKAQSNAVTIDLGWGPDTSAHNVTETDDPLIQQMNIIRNYIRQAREANRYDEVTVLEGNLRELQEEYRKLQSVAIH